MLSISAQIGNRIKYYRNQNNMSQMELANNAEINTSYLGEIERGEKKPTVETLEKVLQALEVTFEEFFSYEMAMNTIKGNELLENLFVRLITRSDKEQAMICDVANRIIDYQGEK